MGTLLAFTATVVFADGGSLDVQVAAKTGYAVDTTTDGAIVEYIGDEHTTFGSAGTGQFGTFLQTQDNPSEEGYNTDGTSEFDTGSSPTFNHAILLSEIPTVTCESLDGSESAAGSCWELWADINDSNAKEPSAAQIQLTDLEIWLTDDNEITGYDQGGTGFGADADLVYDFEGTILINDVNQGSGRGDLRYLIPVDSLTLPANCDFGSSACTTYFVVYTEWGDPEDGAYKSDSGFEEWKVKSYPSLQIVKNTIGGNGTFDFAVTGDPTDPPDTSPSITTTGGTGSTPGYVIDPGTYTIDELGAPSGWAFTGAVCSFNGGAAQPYTSGADIEIDDEDHVVCTFTNQLQGKIITDKVTNPTGDSQLFDFNASWDGGAAPDFQLADATTPNDSGFLAPGTYSVAETVPTGWALTSATCDDGSDPSSINLAAGETVTCTFTNTKQAKILVDKVTTPSGSTQQFEFDPSYSANFFLDDDDPVNDSGFLAAGTYSVAEVNLPAGWSLASATCDDGSPVTAIDLAVGETVTCTFTNQQQGKIITDKVTNPTGDSQLFDFNASWDGGAAPDFQLADATTPNDSGFLAPGTYSVAETVPTGWALTSAACDDGSDPSSINLAAGETVTCTFTNAKLPTIIVEKITTGVAGGPFGFTTTGGHGLLASFSLTTSAPGAAGKDSDTFLIDSGGIGGDFSVTESTLPSGFVLTDVSCVVTTTGAAGTTTGQDLGTKTGTITNLTAGTTVTCTFVNSGALTTRTQGFWSTHSWLVELVWSPTAGTIDTFAHDGMTDAERTLCGHVLTVEEVMGGFWSNIAKQTDGDRRSRLDQARMQLAQQLLAAILNNQLFGSSPSGAISIDVAKDAFCGTDVDAIKDAASAMAAFNESGDSGLFTPGGSADAKRAREIADRVFWDDLP